MPAKTGITKRKIKSDACTDTRPLNVWVSTISDPEFASSARKTMASSPPMRKNRKLVTMYCTPMTLWSVLTRK